MKYVEDHQSKCGRLKAIIRKVDNTIDPSVSGTLYCCYYHTDGKNGSWYGWTESLERVREHVKRRMQRFEGHQY